jgi:iron complex transport system ATP-binding protein
VSASAASHAAAEPTGLRIEAVSVRLGGRSILEEVSVEVRPGEVVGLVGCNGAGKTTLLRVAGGTHRPDAGSVWLAGSPLSDLSKRDVAKRLATVPQDLDVTFPFTAGEIVLMGRAPHQGFFGLESKRDVALAAAAMERLGILQLADRRLSQLSGGERQLVVFARALAQDPSVLLLDEPTSHLDLRHRTDVLSAVRELAREGCSALVVSHDLGLAARACDRLVVLAGGRVHAEGAPSDVLTREVLRSAFDMEAEVVEGPDGLPLVVPRIEAG